MAKKKRIVDAMPNPDVKRFPVVANCLAREIEIEENKYGKVEMKKIQLPDCDKMLDGVCISYENPSAMWRLGCPLASNKVTTAEQKQKLNPIKHSKRRNR